MAHLARARSVCSTFTRCVLAAPSLLTVATCGHPAPRSDARAAYDAGAPDALAADAAPDVATDAPVADAAPAHPRVTITATGDVTLNARLDAMADAHRQEGRLAWFFPTLAAIITPREVALAFDETPLAASARRPLGPGRRVLWGPSAFARDLGRIGFDALSVATEHGYDQQAVGLGETRDALVAAGLGAVGVGAGADEPWRAWTTERDGLRVAVVAASQRGLEQDAGEDPRDTRLARLRDDDTAPLLAAVRAARTGTDRPADVVVAMVHWGRDFVPGVDADRRALARALVDAGADVVLGAGPNVLQPVERLVSPRGDAVVAYSLGNLLSNQGALWRPERPIPPAAAHNSAYDDATREGVLLRVTLEPRDGRLALVYLTAVALWTHQREDEVRVVPVRALDEPFHTARLASIARRLGPAVRVRP